MAKDRQPYRLQSPFGFHVTVKGAARRDEFIRRGYTLQDGAAPADTGPKALNDHTVSELEERASALGVSKAGPKAALVARIAEAEGAAAASTGGEGEGDAGDGDGDDT